MELVAIFGSNRQKSLRFHNVCGNVLQILRIIEATKMVYRSGGYRKLPDGSMEQPADALKRVERRSVFNIAAALVVASAAFGTTLGGFYYSIEVVSNAPQGSSKNEEGADADLVIQSEQIRKMKSDQVKEDALNALFCFGGALTIAVVGGWICATRIARDQRSKAGIFEDIERGMYFDEKGDFIDPHRYYPPQEPVSQLASQTVAPR